MPYDYINETGVVVADVEDTQQTVEDEYKGVFGADFDVSPETPEGLLISAEVTSRNGVATNNALLANQINPNIAAGVFLDALMALTGLTRVAATSSTFSVDVAVSGVPLTFIPQGSIAATVAGDRFVTLSDVTLDVSGLGSVPFASEDTGPIPAGIATLTTIVTGIIGWEIVINSVAATLGTDLQSDIDARAVRKQTLGLQGTATVAAIFAAVRNVNGVRSLTFRENPTSSPITPTPPDNLTLLANTIWLCVDGGSDEDVATALVSTKSMGVSWTIGNSAATAGDSITDPTSGQVYSAIWDIPDIIPVLYEVTIAASTISNATAIVKQAIVDYINGDLEGEEGLVVGADVSPFEAAGAITLVEPGIEVLNVEVTTVAAASFAPVTIAIELFEKATADAGSVTVIVV